MTEGELEAAYKAGYRSRPNDKNPFHNPALRTQWDYGRFRASIVTQTSSNPKHFPLLRRMLIGAGILIAVVIAIAVFSPVK